MPCRNLRDDLKELLYLPATSGATTKYFESFLQVSSAYNMVSEASGELPRHIKIVLIPSNYMISH